MKIIDFYKKGNVVRFYLGDDKETDYWGDDWDDVPYEHNAGQVYDEFVTGMTEIAFPVDWLVLEPCDDWSPNSKFCKEDFKNRKAPCVIAVPPCLCNESWRDQYSDWCAADGIVRFFYEDNMEASDGIQIYGQ